MRSRCGTPNRNKLFLSPGDHPLTKEFEASGYEIGLGTEMWGYFYRGEVEPL